MRRKHNVIAATLFILGIIFLCVQREARLADYDLSLTTSWDKDHDHDRHRVSEKSKNKLATSTHSVTGSGPLPTGKPVHVDHDQSLPPVPVPEQPVSVPEPEVHPEIPAQLPSADLTDPTQQGQDASSQFHADFTFQEDLDVELPTTILNSFSKHPPLHYDGASKKTYAYATFMSTRNPSIKDPYYLAIHSLIHRVLWSPRSQTKKDYPFIVFVANYVTQEQRDLLSGAGAVVRELAPVEWHCDKENVQKRWTDLFAKLHMWAQTDFERIIFLDADAFPLTNIDAMFDLAPVQQCIQQNMQLDDFLSDRSPVCESYIFAGVPQDPEPTHALHPNINVGSMLFTPSVRMHARLLQNYLKYDHYDCAMAEQAFLNWQFSPKGAFPATFLEREWGGFFPREDEEGKLKVVHEKIWAFGDGWTMREWRRGWEELQGWYSSEEFGKVRGMVGVSGR